MKAKGVNGFTIIELVVAIVVGSIMIAAITMMIINLVHLSQRNRDLVIANSYIENKIESLRSIGFAGLGIGTNNISSELPAELNAPRGGTTEITSYSPSIKKVVVSINYNDQGANRSYSYTTYIGELGVGQY